MYIHAITFAADTKKQELLMDVKHLEYIIEIAEQKNMTKSA